MWHVRGLRCKEKEHIQLPDRRRYAKWRNSRRVLTFTFAQLSVITLSVGESFGFHRSCGGTTIRFRKHDPQISPRTTEISDSFFAAAQNDFADRLKWAVTPRFSDANRPPNVRISGPIDVSARASSTVTVEAEVSHPDRNALGVRWWQHNDAGTYLGDITFSAPTALRTTFRVPGDAQPGQTINVVLEATDDGTAHLTRYQRVMVTVQ